MTDEHSEPTEGGDWCPNGCQPLYEFGECGMCGYEGDGVHADETTFVVDACEETGAYTRQTLDGFCCGCCKQHGVECDDPNGSLDLIAEMVGFDEPEDDEDDDPIQPF